MADIKQPLQERAQKTKEMIARKGFHFILKKGIHNVTTNDIADACGVSVGVIYRYYKDKRDILHAGMRAFFEESLAEAMAAEEAQSAQSIREMVTKTFDEYILLHTKYAKTHAEFEVLLAEDEVLAQMNEEYEALVCDGITKKLLAAGMRADHATERVALALGMMELYLNKYVKNEQFDQVYLKELVVTKVLELLEG